MSPEEVRDLLAAHESRPPQPQEVPAAEDTQQQAKPEGNAGLPNAAPPPGPQLDPDGDPVLPTSVGWDGSGAAPDDTRGGVFPKGGQEANPNATPEPGLSDPSAALTEAPVAGAVSAVKNTLTAPRDAMAAIPAGPAGDAAKAVLKAVFPPLAASEALGAAGDAVSVPQSTSEDQAQPTYGLAKGITEFSIGMLGAGKVTEALGVGERLTGIAKMAMESGKVAGVSGLVMDPHGDRLSNLINNNSGPNALWRPVTNYLAAKPGDSAAEGRFKNALENIGLDAALQPVLLAATKLYKVTKAWQAGDTTRPKLEEAQRTVQQAMDTHNDIRDRQEGVPPGGQPDGPATLPGETPDAAPSKDASVAPPAASPVVHPDGSIDLGEVTADTPKPPAAPAYTSRLSDSPGGLSRFAPSELADTEADGGLSGIYHRQGPDGSAQIDNAGLPDSMRGSGQGTAMYKAFVDQMHSEGRDVQSDLMVPPPAARVYSKLRDQGYDVRENPNVHITPDGGRLTTDGQPAFTVKQGGGDGANTVTDLGGRTFVKQAHGEPYLLDSVASPKPEVSGRGPLEASDGDWAAMIARMRQQHDATPGLVKATSNKGSADALAERSTTLKDFFAGDTGGVHPLRPQGQTYSLAKQILSKVGDTKVHFVSDGAMGDLWGAGHSKLGAADGYYDPTQRHIVVRSSSMADPERGAYLMVHEAAHAALFHAISESPAAQESFTRIISLVKRELDARKAAEVDTRPQWVKDQQAANPAPYDETRGWYGLHNAHELVSEAMSNAKFQAMLGSVELNAADWKFLGLDADRPRTLWDAFRTLVRDILGISKDKTTALDAVLRITDRLQQEHLNKQDAQRAAVEARDAADTTGLHQGGGGSPEQQTVDRLREILEQDRATSPFAPPASMGRPEDDLKQSGSPSEEGAPNRIRACESFPGEPGLLC